MADAHHSSGDVTSSGSDSSSGSGSYTTLSSSQFDPPSKVNVSDPPLPTMSILSDPSASVASSSVVRHSVVAPSNSPAFPPFSEGIAEEDNEGVEASSKDLGAASTSLASIHNSNPGRGSLEKKLSHCACPRVDTNNPSSPTGPVLPLECDYDVNPTELYQAIESKQWDHIDTLFSKDEAKAQKQAATWVTRKETNGKLRWRLLPIHAAVIFQSPSTVVERLLNECPVGAQAKDDQGMLPLHLAFRTKTTCWKSVEELITAFPQAVFVKDRKGRTPLQCGVAAATAAVATTEQSKSTSSLVSSLTAANKAQNGRAITPDIQKAIFSSLELYTQITVNDQLQKAMATSRTTLETRIGAVQDSHVATLTQLKDDWERQRNELSKKIAGYKKEIQCLRSDFEVQQDLLEEKVKTEMELVDKLQQVTSALEAKTVVDEETVHDLKVNQTRELTRAKKKTDGLQKTNKDLLLLLEALLDEQQSLKLSLDKLASENKTLNQERKDLLENFRKTNEKSEEMTTQYTNEWQKRLEGTNLKISEKLNAILGQTNPAAANEDDYDGEEKKECVLPKSTLGAHLHSGHHRDNSKDP